MGVCCVCHQEDHTYTFEGGEFCRQCLLDMIETPDVIDNKLPEFVEHHKSDFVEWVTDTSYGDVYRIKEYIEAAKAQAVKQWAQDHPEKYQEAMKDFRTSCPGEWEEYFEEVG